MDQQQSPTPQGQTPSASPAAEPATDLNKELFADLTVGLPGYFRLVQESFALFKLKAGMFLAVEVLPFALAEIVFKLPGFFSQQLSSLGIGYTIISVLASFIALIIASWGYLSLLFAIKDNEEKITIPIVYSRASKHFKQFWKTLLWFLGFISMGSIALFVPGLIFSVWFSVALLINIVEELQGVDALLLSKEYVRKYFMSVLGRIVFMVLLATLFYIPLLIIDFFPIPYLYAVSTMVITLIMLPIVSTYWFLLYGNLRVLRGDTTAYVNVLKESHATKEKVSLFKPTLVKGALAGIPVSVLLIYMFVTRPFVVSGNSMIPAYTNGELILSVYSVSGIERGDAVIAHSPIEPNKQLIKRIVGLPGDSFTIAQGAVYINGAVYNEEKYLPSSVKTLGGHFLQENYTFVIPPRQYVVLGDNRANSEDSREWGPLRTSDIVGIVGYCLWNCPKR
jgi:signal peptidase I